jgi:hypothetical protein
MENVSTFYDLTEYFTSICYNIWLFGIVCGHLVYFPQFGTFGTRKIWQPWFQYYFARTEFVTTTTTTTTGAYIGSSQSLLMGSRQYYKNHLTVNSKKIRNETKRH